MAEHKDISLRDYVDVSVSSLDRRVDARFVANQRELDGTAQALSKRLDDMNHVWQALKEFNSTCITHREHDILAKQVEGLLAYRSNLEGRMVVIPALVSLVIGLLIIGVARWLR